MIRATIALVLISSAGAFTAPAAKSGRVSVCLSAKSKSVPFLQQPKALTGATLYCIH